MQVHTSDCRSILQHSKQENWYSSPAQKEVFQSESKGNQGVSDLERMQWFWFTPCIATPPQLNPDPSIVMDSLSSPLSYGELTFIHAVLHAHFSFYKCLHACVYV